MLATPQAALRLKQTRYAEVSWPGFSWRILKFLVTMPVALCWMILTRTVSDKPPSRAYYDFLIRHGSQSFLWNEFQWLHGVAADHYNAFVKTEKLPAAIEETGRGGKIYWIGPKTSKPIILYVHGGGFVASHVSSSMPFWNWSRLQLKRRGLNIGVAMFNYYNVPEGTFPDQLVQLLACLNHLSNQGIDLTSVCLIGDSAGANLILQLFSHALHPIAGIPLVPKNLRFNSVALISPWVDVNGRSFTSNLDHASRDVLSASTLKAFGQAFVTGVSQEHIAHIDMAEETPVGWFDGIEAFTPRLFVSAGTGETLLSAIDQFHSRHFTCPIPGLDVEFYHEIGGTHDDLFQNFGPFSHNPTGALTYRLLDWIQECITTVE